MKNVKLEPKCDAMSVEEFIELGLGICCGTCSLCTKIDHNEDGMEFFCNIQEDFTDPFYACKYYQEPTDGEKKMTDSQFTNFDKFLSNMFIVTAKGDRKAQKMSFCLRTMMIR